MAYKIDNIFSDLDECVLKNEQLIEDIGGEVNVDHLDP